MTIKKYLQFYGIKGAEGIKKSDTILSVPYFVLKLVTIVEVLSLFS